MHSANVTDGENAAVGRKRADSKIFFMVSFMVPQ